MTNKVETGPLRSVIEGDTPKAPTWLERVYGLSEQGQEDAAVDVVFDELDRMLRAEQFAQCSDILQLVEPQRLAITPMLAILAATLLARHLLPSRAELFERTRAFLSTIEPARSEKLLRGLR